MYSLSLPNQYWAKRGSPDMGQAGGSAFEFVHRWVSFRATVVGLVFVSFWQRFSLSDLGVVDAHDARCLMVSLLLFVHKGKTIVRRHLVLAFRPASTTAGGSTQGCLLIAPLQIAAVWGRGVLI